jgi:hypothetical protein
MYSGSLFGRTHRIFTLQLGNVADLAACLHMLDAHKLPRSSTMLIRNLQPNPNRPMPHGISPSALASFRLMIFGIAPLPKTRLAHIDQRTNR